MKLLLMFKTAKSYATNTLEHSLWRTDSDFGFVSFPFARTSIRLCSEGISHE
jgi:hypothetical protein